DVMTYREALRLALREEMERDPRVFVMGEEVGVFDGAYKVTAGLLEEFGPDRVRDTPISEEGFVGAGVGAAMLGERPVVEIMTINFLLVAIDQVVNHAAKVGAMFGGEVRCPLVIRTPNGAGNQLTAQHSHSLATVRALHVAERLAAEHSVDVEVVDLRSLRPLDMETVAASVAKTNRVVCVEEGWPTYGVSAELAARIQKACFDDLDAPVE